MITPSRSIRIPCVLLLLSILAGGCAPEDSGSDTPDSTESPSVSSSEEPTAAVQEDQEAVEGAPRVALPGLFSIMAGLQADMATVSRGLWIENFDTIAAGATAVADHPMVPQGERQRIAEILGGDMSRFGAMDQAVHDLAVRLAEAADRGAVDEVLSAEAELRRGCVDCHSTFRDRLRDALANGSPTR